MPLTDFSKAQPPRWATMLLRYLCAPHLLEEIEGDLEEEFDYQIGQVGVRRARLGYIRNVFGFMKPFAIKRKSSHSIPFYSMKMYKHYFIVGIRNLIRHRIFSAINISGLALGMICCLFVFLWVQDEKRVDNFHTTGEQLFTVYATFTTNGQKSGGFATPDTMAAELKKAIPDVEFATAYTTGYELPWGHPETFQVGEKLFKFEGSRASEDFFKMFSYSLVAGDPGSALKDKSSLAISRKMAEMFFASPREAIGKSIRYENRIDFTIAAVFENLPDQSSLKFDFLINWEMYQSGQVEQASWNTLTVVRLHPGANVKSVETKMQKLWESHIRQRAGYQVGIGLQRFGDRYLYGNFVNGKPDGGRIEYVRIFTGVAFFILVIACINFMNLATARSVKRAKEIGVRKVVGSSRSYLIGQFFGESLLISLLALAISLLFLQLLLPSFNAFTEKNLLSPVLQPSTWPALITLVLITGLIAGSYPALFLSSLKPVNVLKGIVKSAGGAIWIRKGLAVFQFSLSIILVIAAIVVSQQTGYVQNAHLGYDRENLIYIRVEGELKQENKYLAFKEQASRMPGVAMIDRSSEAPHAMGFGVADAIDWEGKNKEMTVGMNNQAAVQFENAVGSSSVVFYPSSVGYDFLTMMKLKVVEGRGFSRDYLTDSAAFIINETAARQMGVKDPIGKWISAWDKKGHIIGIVKDFHMNSLHEPIKPVLLDVKEDLNFGVIMVRTEAGKTKEALASLEKASKEFNPNYPFVYQFLNQEYGKLYKNEQVMSKLSNAFAILAILISSLGLLGLVMFSAEQRMKEIGIRKVLGATILNIFSLLSGDFVKLVLIAFAIAAPVAGYFMYEWLQQFTFKIDLAWWIFLFAGGTSLFIALVTISFQVIQSATTSPVKSLRSE
jgi:putative ABC transport system permease protein